MCWKERIRAILTLILMNWIGLLSILFVVIYHLSQTGAQ